MRRWAATINETKNSKSKKSGSDYKKDNSSASADAGFAVLSKKVGPSLYIFIYIYISLLISH